MTTPLAVIVDVAHVDHVRAEDETGAFGILPGHADFLTVLSISVITWRDQAAASHHVAVRGGVMTVKAGNLVEVATRDAVGEDTLQLLGTAILDRFRADAQAESESRMSATRLQLATIRQLQRFLDVDRIPVGRGAPPKLDAGMTRHTLSAEGDTS